MEFFNADWAKEFGAKWNADPDMVVPLAQADFGALIGFGYPGEPAPRVLVEIQRGRVVRAGQLHAAQQTPSLDWDLRAKPEQWLMWRTKPLTLASLGVATQNGLLEFAAGDYRKMIRTPALAGPFLRFFNLL